MKAQQTRKLSLNHVKVYLQYS